jgi:hypothetical protein
VAGGASWGVLIDKAIEMATTTPSSARLATPAVRPTTTPKGALVDSFCCGAESSVVASSEPFSILTFFLQTLHRLSAQCFNYTINIMKMQ